MRYRRLGSSDLVVSEVSLGSWLTYGSAVAREHALACIERAFACGMNFFDTANVYGHGRAEEFLGETLAARPRDQYVLATKLYFPMPGGDRGLSREQVRKQIDASLRRLRVEYVDLYQCHRYDAETPLEETMEALTEVVAAGKARYVGFSEWSSDQIRAALALPRVERFVSSQPQYSLLWRAPERDVFALCAANGISQIVWSPLAQGVLTGKYRPGRPPPGGSRAAAASSNFSMRRFFRPEVLEGVQRLLRVAEARGLTLAQLALAWVLREPNVASAIVGASRPEQVDANAAASGIELDERTLGEIDEALAGAVLA
ncbi:MAG: aldo/keto reductase family protein [Thermoleophilia bacterium]|nr:aldo/keto reductase family protein [Thermoleophilia bacterium]